MPMEAGTPWRSSPRRAISLLARAASVPLPMAHPTSAVARAGASLIPSPTMRTRLVAACSARNSSTLAAGLNAPYSESTRSADATACTAGSLSPLRMMVRRPMERSCATASAASGRIGVVTATAPMTASSRSTTTTVSPRSSRSDTEVASSVGRRTLATRTTRIRWPATVPSTPTPGRTVAPSARGRCWRGGTDGTGDGVVALGFHGGGQRHHLVAGDTGDGHDVGDSGEALGQGARLVEDDGVHLGQPLEALPAADEDAECRGATATDHHGHRRGQSHGAGARHQQESHGTEHGLPEVAGGQPPDQERHRRGGQDDGDEDAAHPVGDALQGRLVALRLLHQSLQAGQDRFGGHRGDADDEDATSVLRPPRHQTARTAFHGQGLAGEHRLVDGRPSAHHLAVERHRLAGADADQGADGDALGRYELALVVVGPGHDAAPSGVAAPATSAWHRRHGGAPGPRWPAP